MVGDAAILAGDPRRCAQSPRTTATGSSMSLLETPMTHAYWRRVGGTLLEEFLIVPASPGVGLRRAGAIIILGGRHGSILRAEKSVSLDGQDLIIVHTKARRLGIALLGEAFFSRELVKERFAPRSVRA